MNGGIKKKLKKLYIQSTQNVSHLKRGVVCDYKWHGGDYAGFYVSPTFLGETSIVYSFGIGKDISFDESIINAYGCNVYGFDPTPKSIEWITNLATPLKFHFNDFGIGAKTEDTMFYLPVNQNHVSGSLEKHRNVNDKMSVKVHMKSIGDIAHLLGHSQIDILKMDIEGSEYEVVESILNSDLKINQILIEFHDRFFKGKTPKSFNTVQQMRDNGYEIFAVSDSYEEVSFIRRNLVSKQ